MRETRQPPGEVALGRHAVAGDQRALGDQVEQLQLDLPVRGAAGAGRAEAAEGIDQRGAIRSAPSMRMISPFSIGLRTIAAHQVGELVGPAEPRRVRHRLAERDARRFRQARQQRRVEQARRDRRRRGSRCGPGRARRAGPSRDAALGRAVGDLADLPVEGRDRGRQHDHAALALVVRLVAGHRRGRGAQRVERADQVDLDRAPERVVGMPHHATDRPDAGARHADAQRRRSPAPPRPRPGRRAASRRRRSTPSPGARSRRVTASPSAVNRAAVAAPRPDAPPVTSALASHRRYRRRGAR